MFRKAGQGIVAIVAACFMALPAHGQAATGTRQIQEELIGLLTPIPMLAFSARPVGSGPLPLVIMNHGVAIGSLERSFFPQVEYREALRWFARRGYLVISPVRPGYGSFALNKPEHGLFPIYFADIGDCAAPNFRDPGLAVATMNKWIIDFAIKSGMAKSDGVIVVGQSGGGWGALALTSQNPPPVKAVITFAAGRGGHLDGKPNNNCAPDKLVKAGTEFGSTARIPTLMIYAENDTYFGPGVSKPLFEAYRDAGGKAEYHLVPAFGDEGHLLIDYPAAVPIWAPIVERFLEKNK